MTGGYIVSQENWSLHRKGHLDQQRHQEKVREAIKNNLADIVSEESIILSDGDKILKIPIRSLEEYRIRFNHNKQKHAGEGDGDTKKGDVIAKDNARGRGSGQGGAGNEPGVDYYEAEITVDELAEMIFADLSLPNLQQKKWQQIESETVRFNDVRKHGLISNIDKKRTIVENMRRNALNGEPGLHGINPNDLRFRTWEQTVKFESNAVVLAMMDTSGSMGTFEKYISRSFFFWMVKFLRTKYSNVQIIFLAHHVAAKEVSEQEFFTKGESGGTKCSSVYQLALDLIGERYHPNDFNIYPFHFSDGDNLPSDNDACIQMVQQLIALCNAFGYGEIVNPYYRRSTLMNAYQRIKNPKFVSATLKDKSDVYSALRAFFSSKGEAI